MRKISVPKKPSGFLYRIGMLVFRRFCRKQGLCFSGSDLLPQSGPYYILSNHAAMPDFMYAYVSIAPRRPNAVVSDYFFCSGFMSFLMRELGCIPAKQFIPDPACIRSIGAAINAGRGILLFPEGMVSGFGFFDGMPRGTGKLLRRYPAPVYSMRISGDCLSQPKWASSRRHGKVEVTLSPLFSADEIADSTPSQLDEAIAAATCYDEYDYSRKSGGDYSGDALLEGFTNLVYLCPKCGSLYTLSASGDHIRCSACGNSGHMDTDGLLYADSDGDVIPPDPGAWIRLQMDHERALVNEQGDAYRIDCPADLKRMKGHLTHVGYEKTASGDAALTPDGISFCGKDLRGDDVDLFFKLGVMYKLTYTRRGEMKLPVSGDGIAVQPHDIRISGRWICAWNALKEYSCRS